ncbi:hypothetical protein E2C01_060456 [Portunus trituberculatus]|uniref:Uncharacterized protein n=1 Tax=Portunus trituberculatus TaxID=210409 RepID=A0A5B7H934_PORTR|nr:hypothetical protein [Portunus trituberculatus]
MLYYITATRDPLRRYPVLTPAMGRLVDCLPSPIHKTRTYNYNVVMKLRMAVVVAVLHSGV